MTAATFRYYRGRVALSAILRGLGLGPGDEVIVQAYTCAAVPHALLHLGVRPVYVDIGRHSFTMDLDRLRHAISTRTRAIVVQHTFGIPADVSGVLEIARGVPVVEDCAHVLGSRLEGRPVGSFGTAAIFSYEWGKPVVAGVGGAAVVNDAALAERMRIQYGSFTDPPLRREVVMSGQYLAHRAVSNVGRFWQIRALYRRLTRLGLMVGSHDADPRANPEYGWRMTRSVRRRLPVREAAARTGLDRRRHIAGRYRDGLDRLGFAAPAVPAGADAVLMRVPVVVTAKRRVLEAAARTGVELGDWFDTPVHPLSGPELESVGYAPRSCPDAEWLAAHVVTLPVRANTRPEDTDRALDLLARLRATGDA